jgi:hypothetical protein
MIISVKRILRRRSGVARAERKALSTRDLLGVTGCPAGDRLGRFTAGGNTAWPPGNGKPGTLRGALHPKRDPDSNRTTVVCCTPGRWRLTGNHFSWPIFGQMEDDLDVVFKASPTGPGAWCWTGSGSGTGKPCSNCASASP